MNLKIFAFLAFFLVLLLFLVFRKELLPGNRGLFSRNNLLAWCIVPYDSMKRSPEQRALMLKELGISKFAWDWREEHLPLLRDEIAALRARNISLEAAWFWVNGGEGDVIDETNRYILDVFREEKVKTELWVCFNNSFFEGLNDSVCLDKAVKAVKIIYMEAVEAGCRVALYNHGDWFGEPENQVRIIEGTGFKDIGIVYNFHHAHLQIDRFPELLRKMMPYLRTVNISGMRAEGPKILPVGSGDREQEMLEELKKSGFNGRIGIIGHTEGEDARVVLERNLKGFKILLKKMNENASLKTYVK